MRRLHNKVSMMPCVNEGRGALTDVADDITTTIERLRQTEVPQRRVIERRQLHILRCNLDSEIFIRFDILQIYGELELDCRLVVDRG